MMSALSETHSCVIKKKKKQNSEQEQPMFMGHLVWARIVPITVHGLTHAILTPAFGERQCSHSLFILLMRFSLEEKL